MKVLNSLPALPSNPWPWRLAVPRSPYHTKSIPHPRAQALGPQTAGWGMGKPSPGRLYRSGQRAHLGASSLHIQVFKAICRQGGLRPVFSKTPSLSASLPPLFLDVKALTATVCKTFLKPGCLPRAQNLFQDWVNLHRLRVDLFLESCSGLGVEGSCNDQQNGCWERCPPRGAGGRAQAPHTPFRDWGPFQLPHLWEEERFPWTWNMFVK